MTLIIDLTFNLFLFAFEFEILSDLLFNPIMLFVKFCTEFAGPVRCF